MPGNGSEPDVCDSCSTSDSMSTLHGDMVKFSTYRDNLLGRSAAHSTTIAQATKQSAASDKSKVQPERAVIFIRGAGM